MQTITLHALLQALGQHLDQVLATDTPLRVRLPDGRAIVVMSQRDYNGTQETLHLLSSPRNAERLFRSIAQAEAGIFAERSLTMPGQEE